MSYPQIFRPRFTWSSRVKEDLEDRYFNIKFIIRFEKFRDILKLRLTLIVSICGRFQHHQGNTGTEISWKD